MLRILVSSCLLGDPVRYNGRDVRVEDRILARWQREGRIVACCPELAGGLAVPRRPAEIARGDSLTVLDSSGADVSAAFHKGAGEARQLAREMGVRAAILTDGSPSCGTSYIYDGSFTRTRRPGMGLTAALLEADGIAVFSQFRIAEAERYLASLEALTCPAAER